MLIRLIKLDEISFQFVAAAATEILFVLLKQKSKKCSFIHIHMNIRLKRIQQQKKQSTYNKQANERQ